MERILLGNVKGNKGDEGKSAYELAVINGFFGTETEWLESLRGEPGDDGASAYAVAVRNGFLGTEPEWLETLRGTPGDPGPAGCYDILASVEEVSANAEAGKIVDALAIKEVFQSVSEGKAMLASAITGKGVPTDASDIFQKMAENISAITSGGNEGGLEGVYDRYTFVSATSTGNQNKTYKLTLSNRYSCAVAFLLTLSPLASTNSQVTLNGAASGILVSSGTFSVHNFRMVAALDTSIAGLEPDDEYTVDYSYAASGTSNTFARGIVLLIR